MPSVNKVILIGNLTRDVETRATPSGMITAELGLALNRKWKDAKTNAVKEETTFVDVELWGKTAELAQKYLSKGRSVYIEGRLRLDQWEDKQTGQKRQKLKIVGDALQFLGEKQGSPEKPMKPSEPDDLALPTGDIPF
jgi:single-strand DNA-binding protein